MQYCTEYTGGNLWTFKAGSKNPSQSALMLKLPRPHRPFYKCLVSNGVWAFQFCLQVYIGTKSNKLNTCNLGLDGKTRRCITRGNIVAVHRPNFHLFGKRGYTFTRREFLYISVKVCMVPIFNEWKLFVK